MGIALTPTTTTIITTTTIELSRSELMQKLGKWVNYENNVS
jgi:hypothetical protein